MQGWERLWPFFTIYHTIRILSSQRRNSRLEYILYVCFVKLWSIRGKKLAFEVREKKRDQSLASLLIYCVILDALFNLSEPISSSVKWRQCYLLHGVECLQYLPYRPLRDFVSACRYLCLCERMCPWPASVIGCEYTRLWLFWALKLSVWQIATQ